MTTFDPARRYAFLVTGPNASGKTTALTGAMDAYNGDPRVRAVYADNRDRRMFDGDKTTMTATLCAVWDGPEHVVAVEGTRLPSLVRYVTERRPGVRDVRAFITLSDAATMRALLVRRCALTGKRFRDEYWTDAKLTYEGTRRYRNSVPRFVPEEAIGWWTVDAGYGAAVEMSASIRAALNAILGEPRPIGSEILRPPVPTGQACLF